MGCGQYRRRLPAPSYSRSQDDTRRSLWNTLYGSSRNPRSLRIRGHCWSCKVLCPTVRVPTPLAPQTSGQSDRLGHSTSQPPVIRGGLGYGTPLGPSTDTSEGPYEVDGTRTLASGPGRRRRASLPSVVRSVPEGGGPLEGRPDRLARLRPRPSPS